MTGVQTCALPIYYLVRLLGIWNAIDARYETDVGADTRALLAAYAAGLNLYAAQHRNEVLSGFAPAKPQDVVALYMLRLPFFYGLDEQLRSLLAAAIANCLRAAILPNARSALQSRRNAAPTGQHGFSSIRKGRSAGRSPGIRRA